jgi:hypothetical protein
LTTIGLTSDRARHDALSARRSRLQFFVACVPVLLAPAADAAPLVAIVGVIASLCLCQALLAQARHAALRDGAEPELADLSV